MMTRARLCGLVPKIAFSFAVVLVFLAIGADLAGVDPGDQWGFFRNGFFIVGLVGIFFIVGLKLLEVVENYLVERRILSVPQSRNIQIENQPGSREQDPSGDDESGSLSNSSELRGVDRSGKGDSLAIRTRIHGGFASHRKVIGLVGLVVFVELLYVWFISVGHMTYWPTTTSYYAVLGESFMQGQPSLYIEPDPRLAYLENPYPLENRQNIPAVGDASYYYGKYYFYWGPIPAFFAAAGGLLTTDLVGDEYIVFASVSCIFLFSFLILLYLRRTYFSALPTWLLLIGILIIATAHPLLWILNWPSIYPAAISSGQAFLIAGLFFALPLIDGSQNQPWRFALTGILWALAIGSRITLAPTIILLAMVIAVRQVFLSEDGRLNIDLIKRLAILALPMVMGLALLAYYNLIRFGDFFEVGLRYQLSEYDYPHMFSEGLVFNPIYVLPNLFYYLVAPIRYISRFPIIHPLWVELPEASRFFARFNLPAEYHVEDISGLLFTIPTIVFVVSGAWNLFCPRKDKVMASNLALKKEKAPAENPGLKRVYWTLLIAAIIAFVPLLFYFWVSNRFLMDVVPILAILASVGVWLFYQSTREYPLRGPLAGSFIFITVILGVVISLLLGVSGADSRFDRINPELFQTLSELFSIK